MESGYAGAVDLLQRVGVKVAGSLPTGLKRWIHRHRMFDTATRRWYGAMVAGTAVIESGPLAGVRLCAGEHVSHAHIRGTYELATQEAIAASVRPGMVCYDLGASIGYLALLMAHRGARRVYAFEPAPHAQSILAAHIRENGMEDRIELVPVVVADRPQKVRFGLSRSAYGSRIVDADRQGEHIDVTATTLDDFVETHDPPDFIKIDVEGAESAVLRGGRRVLERRPVICVEIHSHEQALAVSQILSEYGYTLSQITESGQTPYSPGEARPGDVQVMAVPAGRIPLS